MLTQLSVYFMEVFLVFSCVKWIIPFFQSKSDKDMSVATFMSWVALLSGIIISCGVVGHGFVSGYFPLLSLSVVLLATVGCFFYSSFQEKKIKQLVLTALFCGVGLFLTPNGIPMTAMSVFFALLGWVLWIAFIYMMQQFDRVFLFSFSVFSVLFITASLMTSNVFPLLESSFQFLCLSILIVLGVLAFLWKKIGLFFQGSSMVFFLSYIIGYFGFCLSMNGMGEAVPLFIAYELLEIIIAFCTNFYLHHKVMPIEVPFLIERAIITGVDTAKVIKKVFSISFFFAMLGLISSYVLYKEITVMGIKNITVMYLFAAVLLLQTYIVLTSWGKPKVEFKNMFRDIKAELKKAKTEILSKKELIDKNKK